jgi:hypothetical protein
VTDPDPLERLKRQTKPIPGNPGWRVDEQGRRWYRDAWRDPTYIRGRRLYVREEQR